LFSLTSVNVLSTPSQMVAVRDVMS
jgi:hypothetical protein